MTEEAKRAKEEAKRAKDEAKRAKDEAKRAKDEAKQAAKDAAKRAKDEAKRAKDAAKRAKDEAKQAAKDAAKRAKDKAERAKDKAEQAAKDAANRADSPDKPAGIPKGAIGARTLADFGHVDRSLVYPRGAAPTIDLITQVAPYTFNFLLRHRGSWYDGDRDLKWNYKGHPKSRAEVSLKQPRIRVGDTWEFGTTVRLDPDFVPSKSYSNLAQPVFSVGFFTLVDQQGDTITGNYIYNANPDAIGRDTKLVRSVKFQRGEWTTFAFRINFAKQGSIEMSMNGDPFTGLKGVNTSRAKKPNYKIGLYGTGLEDVHDKPLKDSQVQHKNIYMVKR